MDSPIAGGGADTLVTTNKGLSDCQLCLVVGVGPHAADRCWVSSASNSVSMPRLWRLPIFIAAGKTRTSQLQTFPVCYALDVEIAADIPEAILQGTLDTDLVIVSLVRLQRLQCVRELIVATELARPAANLRCRDETPGTTCINEGCSVDYRPG